MFNRFKKRILRKFLVKNFPKQYPVSRLNLCSGGAIIPGYCNLDIHNADIEMDISEGELPFRDTSLDSVVCMSAINYFTRGRAQKIIAEIYRTLKVGGVVRIGVQDMEKISKWYVEKNNEFFFQKLPNGRERFEGPTLGDKFAAWFYGYLTAGGPCRYFYDYGSLEWLCKEAGFKLIEKREYLDSRLADIKAIDNRPEQMFFLEAVK